MSEHVNTPKSILEMANGAFLELTDREMGLVLENIQDVNTSAKAKRKITVTLTFIPDESRQNIAVEYSVNSKLAPVKPVLTFLYADDSQNAVELTRQIPGQADLYGGEQATPPKLRLIAND